MKKINWLLGLLCFSLSIITNASAQTLQFTRLVDTSTPIPNGTGNFKELEAPYLYQSKIVFRGYGDKKQEGIYTNLTGKLSVVADQQTAIPDGKGNFIHFAEPTPYSKETYHKYQILSFNSPAINTNSVIFIGEGKNKQAGVYLYHQNKLQKIVDASTSMPNYVNKFAHFYSPYLNNGNPAFVGESRNGRQQGMYELINNKLAILYDKNTKIPDSGKRFAAFWNPDFEGGHVAFWGIDKAKHVGIYDDVTGKLRVIANQQTSIPNGYSHFIMLGAPSLQNGKVAFRGVGRNGQNGIYSNLNGELEEIATTNTDIPEGKGKFTGVYNPTIDADSIVFQAKGENKQAGIYSYHHGKLEKIITIDDQLDGKKIKQLDLGAVSLSNNQVAFRAIFQDHSQALYLTNLP